MNREGASFCSGCGKYIKADLGKSKTAKKMPVTQTLVKGDTLKDRYEIWKLLSAGGMGYVYNAWDHLSKREVAVKELIDQFTNPKTRMIVHEQFNREISILKALKHKGIPEFFDNFIANERSYIVMEMVEGIDLRKVIIRLKEGGKSLPMEMALQWALETCDVLEYLHSRQPPIIYRDLKPSNIMITPKGKVKLVDFGIARFFVPRVRGTMVGTQGYAPPEQYRGEAEPRSDIYSLGATLHHLLSGSDPQLEAPFDFKPLRELNPLIPVRLEWVVHKALSLDADERFPDAKMLKEELSMAIEAEDLFEDLHQQIDEIQSKLEDLRQRRSGVLSPSRTLYAGSQVDEIDEETAVKTDTSWLHFRGDILRTGSTPVSSTLRGHMKWEQKLGKRIEASALIDADEHVYVGAHDRGYFSMDEKGEILWAFKTRGPVSSTAAMDRDGNSFTACEGGFIYAIKKDGSEIWSKSFRYPFKSSILLTRNRLITADIEGRIYCLDTLGNVLWHLQTEGAVIASPTAGFGGVVYVGALPGILKAIDLEGNVLWTVNLDGMTASTPAVSTRGDVFIGDEEGYLYCIDPIGDIKWKFKTGGWIRSSPAVSRTGMVYIGSSDNYLYCVDPEGVEKWRFDAGDYIQSSPVLSDEGTVYFASGGGTLFALHPYGKSKWWFSLNAGVEASPSIGPGGKLYVGSTNGDFMCIS